MPGFARSCKPLLRNVNFCVFWPSLFAGRPLKILLLSKTEANSQNNFRVSHLVFRVKARRPLRGGPNGQP